MTTHYDSDSGLITVKRKRTRNGSARGFAAADNPQFLASWATSQTGPNTNLQSDLNRVIEMARDLQDDPYGASFYGHWVGGVVGSRGYTLESCAMDANGTVDAADKREIEEAWAEWKKAPNCTPSGDIPYCEWKRLNELSYARDGGVLIKMIPAYDGNEFGFAVQSIEVDQIDLRLNVSKTRDGNRIIMGKEIDDRGRCVAYHLFGEHPGETYTTDGGYRRTRVSSEGFLHRFVRRRHAAYQGVPLPIASMVALRHLNRYAEAEVISARISACAVMKEEYTDGVAVNDGKYDDDVDNFDLELDPATKWDLPFGKRGELIKPAHPNSSYPEFQKAVLRGAASGVLMNYNLVSGDLEGVNYSSLREGKLSQNRVFEAFQTLNIECEEEPIFRAWLRSAMISRAVRIPFSRYNQKRKAKWHRQAVPWVDPLKEANASKVLLDLGLTSPRRVMASLHSDDPDTIMAEIAEDRAKMEALGITMEPAPPAPQEPPSPIDDDDMEEGDDEPTPNETT